MEEKGILEILNENNENLIDIEASSILRGNLYQLLNKDLKSWMSKDIKNSWIQFDFKSKYISLKSYLISSFHGPKSWKIEGSNDLKSFILLDLQKNLLDFQNQNTKVFKIENNKNKFRYIRITQGDEGGWYYNDKNSNFFQLSFVEFYGNIY